MDIFDVLDKHNVDYQSQGDLYVAYCPFHNDTGRPNFTIYPKTNSYYCYSCAKGGGPVEFIMAAEGKTKEEATLIVHEDLSFLIKKLEEEPPTHPVNDEANLQLSIQIRDFLKVNPDKISKILGICRRMDETLNKGPLTREEAADLTQRVTKVLNSLNDKM
jgi:DNA primase